MAQQPTASALCCVAAVTAATQQRRVLAPRKLTNELVRHPASLPYENTLTAGCRGSLAQMLKDSAKKGKILVRENLAFFGRSILLHTLFKKNRFT